MAAEGVDDDHSAWQAVDAQSASVPVQARGQVIATLVAGPSPRLDPEAVMALLHVGAGPLGVALSMSRELGGLRHRAAATLVSDLLDRRVERRPDLMMRSRAAGFDPAGAACIVPVAIAVPVPRMAAQLTATVTKKLAVQSLHADVHATSYALFAMIDPGRDPVTDVCAAFSGSADEATVVVGNPVRLDGRELSDSLLAARRALGVAAGSRRAMARHSEAVSTVRALAAELAVETLDAAVRDDLVSSSISPLINWDRAHGSELTHTLEVHLRHGCSATRSAVALHLGRQSLYQRLERIRELLGFDFAAPDTYPTLLFALCAHRGEMRSGRDQATD
jgi:purine catabolism regulator